MKKAILPLLFLALTAVLAYTFYGFSLLLGMLIGLSFVFLLIVGLIRIFRKRMHRNWYQIPLITIIICLLGIGVNLLRPYDPAVIDSGNAQKDLAYAYQTDQQDRFTIKSYLGSKEELRTRDSIRLELVQRLYRQDSIETPLDKFHAAFIYHHTDSSELYEIANKLASEAAAAEELKDHYQVQWLAKASFDRWMVSLGKPEKYGTQDSFTTDVEVE